jgi:hypothetical protein
MIDAATESATLTREERQLRLLMGICVVAFGGTMLSFLFAPAIVGRHLGTIGDWLGFANTTPPTPGGPWVPLSVSMMAMITVICALAWRDVRHNRPLIPILLVSKAASSVVGLGTFLVAGRGFHDLVVFVTDFPIFLLCAVMFWRAAPRR